MHTTLKEPALEAVKHMMEPLELSLTAAVAEACEAPAKIAQVAYEAIANGTGIFLPAWDSLPAECREGITDKLHPHLSRLTTLGGVSAALDSLGDVLEALGL